MDIKRALAEKKEVIDAAIEKVVPRHLNEINAQKILGKPRFAYDLPVAEKAVNQLIWDLLDRGGKRWRPALLVWSAEAVGGKKAKKRAMDFTAIPEVVHNGTLVIDDLEDDSIHRRGKKCLHRLYGTDLAVNAGNAMYFLPLQILAQKRLPDKMKNQAYQVVVQEMVNLSYGQGFDIYWHKGHGQPSENQYLQMCAFKTGTLSRMSAKLGGILGKGTAKQVNALGEFAESLGIAFQIQDDVLNLVLPKGAWGKDVGEDITEGKRSLLVIHACEKLAFKEKKELLDILNSHTRKSNRIARAISLILKTGAVSYAEKKAEELVDAAWKKLAPMIKDGEAKNALKALAYYAIRRQQ